jgi:orotate phosphoribosyltransferase
MEAMDNLQLASDVNVACRLLGEFELRSGQRSNEYFDKYLFETDPAYSSAQPKRWLR